MPDHFNIHRDMHHSLFYYKNLQKVLDARATRKADLLLRKRIIDNKNKQNYQLEYDRIRDLVHSKTIRDDTKEMLKNRIKKLEELGAHAINFRNRSWYNEFCCCGNGSRSTGCCSKFRWSTNYTICCGLYKTR